MVERNIKEYQTVVLAALLHDIGKLLGRGSFPILDKGQHPKFSADFVRAFTQVFSSASDVSVLQELVQRHHENKQHFDPEFLVQPIKDEHIRALATLVSEADNLSSSERGRPSEQWQDYKETPLASVLERVNHVGSEKTHLRYHARPLVHSVSLDIAFPTEFTMYAQGELNRHIKQFGEDFGNLFRNSSVDIADFACLLSHLLNVLYKYTWCVPSNTQEAVPDVSLFDHLRTTAAIASSLYIYHLETRTLKEDEIRRPETKRFCLVVGDLSGIQDYIFDIATISAGGGVARRLRARSLYVQLFVEVAAHLILRKLGLPIMVHIIMNSGGRFYLLVPNLPEIATILHDIQRTIDSWFLRELNGELALNLAWVPFGDEGFKAGEDAQTGFSEVLGRVSLDLGRRKRNRFAEVLSAPGSWVEDYFQIETSYEGRASCISCKKFPQAEEELCYHCWLDQQIGRILPRAKYLAFFDSDAGEIPVLGYSISVWDSVPSALGDNRPYLVIKLSDPNLTDIGQYPAMLKYLATYVAKPDDCQLCHETGVPIATFECLAHRSQGEDLLGFLKMDVDKLGESFIFGLKSETGSVDTVSRITTFSRMLDLFFSGWIERLTAMGGDFYTVFSGGDDLLLVGPWDKILDIAGDIRIDFMRFTGNSTLTLSAGVLIATHNFPIASAALVANEAVKQSKQKGRDRITILGTTRTWEDWNRVKNDWQQLRPLIEAEQIPSAFLYSLLRFSAMWRQYKDQEDTLGLRYHPLLAYSVSRNLHVNKTPKLWQWANKILTIRPGDKEQEFMLDNLGLIASLLIYSKRGGGE